MKRILPIILIGLCLAFPVLAAVEDFSTFTEVDTGNYLTITAPKINVAVTGNTAVYAAKDYGIDHFDALDVDVELLVWSSSTASIYGGMGFATTTDIFNNWGNNAGLVVSISKQGAGAYIWEWTGGIVNNDYWTGASQDTPYYLTITRAAGNNTVVVTIYDDAARTSLKDTLSMNGVGTAKWPYAYGFINWTTYPNNFYGYIQNMDLNEAVVAPEEEVIMSQVIE